MLGRQQQLTKNPLKEKEKGNERNIGKIGQRKNIWHGGTEYNIQ